MKTTDKSTTPRRSSPPPSHNGGPDGFRRTRDDHAQELAEDYVELIDDLMRQYGEARLVDIAKHIGVTHVTANKTIARLQRDGLVNKRPYRGVFLTPDGAKLAHKCRARHELVYNFLRAIGVPHTQAGIDAEGIEHHISDATLRAMARHVKSAD